jgi:hypothetical protein
VPRHLPEDRNGFRSTALLARLAVMAMLATACGCATPPKKLGAFGLASTEGRPTSFRRIGPAEGVACGFSGAGYAAAVLAIADALAKRPEANALTLVTLHATDQCYVVEGTPILLK